MLNLLKKMKWFRILRTFTPIAYTGLLIMGFMTKTLVFMIILMGSTLLGGAWFCGWLCPLGFTQEWIGKLGRLLRIPRIRIPQKVSKWLTFY
jgi:polyferredoxin